MSIRLRLTLLYSGILALTLIVLGVVLMVSVTQADLRTVETTLHEDAERTISSRGFRLDGFGYDPRRIAEPDTYMQTVDSTGAVLARTANLGSFQLPLDANDLSTASNGQAWTSIVPTDNGRLMVYNQPIAVRGQFSGVIQVARSLAEQDDSLVTLRNALLIGSVFVVALAFLVGWVLSGMALRPIQRITDTAHIIGAQQDFERRVDYRGPPDEVGQLATTFNGMLDELQGAHQQTEQTLQRQRRFVADASHELRTPLTTIRGNLGLLQRQPPITEDDERAVLGDMVDETNRLIRLVNDLLALARSDAGRSLRQEPVPIAPLLEDVYRQVRLLDEQRTIVCEDIPAANVLGDQDAIKQVLLILLDNALKFTPEDGTITIGATKTHRVAAVYIRDTGPGIAPETLPHIFERFYQSDESRTGSGAGLGLAIAQELIEAQQGEITVESQLGKGSIFTVRLPLA